jgi:CheY-like chemotaxis protein
MARIVCFTDSAALVRAVRLGLADREHAIHPLPASLLTDDLRRTVRQLTPDLVLLELTRSADNPHLFFFLRSDEATRSVPVVMLAPNAHMEFHASALGAEAFLTTDFAPADLRSTIAPLLGANGSPPLPFAPQPTIELPPRHAPRRIEPTREPRRQLVFPATL